ncbi:MAG: dienelactone hydrolase family protein [Acidimicrobiales bacterium]
MRIHLESGTPAELVRPDEPAAGRGLVVIPDIGGLRPLFDDHVARLAADTGWAVCAVELWPGEEGLTLEERLARVGTRSDERVLQDAVAAADATGCETVGVIGFCMGGMYATKAAASGRFHRAVSFYGMIRVPEQWRSPTQGEPLELLANAPHCPLLAVVGTADPWTPSADVDDLEALPQVRVVRYEGADHGFVHDPSRPAHRPDDAADAWRRAIDFLGT